ncbi:MAG: CHASE domain-containing protein [Nitrospinae bacterium]|nr:CHASE domain-containing protein [Nitrospinota bacterium]
MKRLFSFLEQKWPNRAMPPFVFALSTWFVGLFVLALALSVLIKHTGIPFTPYRGEVSEKRDQEFRHLSTIANFKKARLLRLVEERKGDLRIQSGNGLLQAYAKRVGAALRDSSAEIEVRRIARGDRDYSAVIGNFKLLTGTYFNIYRDLQIADARTGRVIASLNEAELGKKVAGQAYFSAPIETGDFHIDIVKDAEGKQYEFIIAYPIQSAGGKPGAVLVAKLEVHGVLEPLLDTAEGLGRTGEVVLLSKNGLLLTPNKVYLSTGGKIAKPLESLAPAVPLRMAVMGREDVVEGQDYLGVEVFAATRFIPLTPEFGLGMVVKEDRAEAMAEVYREIWHDVVMGGIGLLIALGMFRMVMKKLPSRIESAGQESAGMNYGTSKARPGEEGSAPAIPGGAWVNTLLVFLISLSFVALAWNLVNRNIQNEANLRMDSRVDQVQTAIANHLQGYEQILRGGEGLFLGSQSVERNEWRDYVESLKVSQHYPGIQGVGFAKRVSRKEIAAHTRAIRAEGFPLYSVRPEGKRDEYYPIIYIEPFRDRNLRAFGYDMFSEEVRRAAMIRARDTGGTAVSGKVRLVQETEAAPQAGFLMYIPVYKNGAPHQTPEERRKNITGFVYSPFRMNDLMTGILGQANPDIDLEIYDGQEASPSALMYDGHAEHSHKPLFERTTRLEMGGAVWTLKVGTLPPFEEQMETGFPLLVLAGGMFVSLLLAAITWSVSTTGERARALAYRMTQAKKESEERYRAILESSSDLIAVSVEGVIAYMNSAGIKMLGGAAPEDVVGMPVAKFLLPAEHGLIDGRRSRALEEWREQPLLEHRVIRLDGKMLDVEARVTPLVYNGKKAVQAIIRDRTELKRLTSQRDLVLHNSLLGILMSRGGKIAWCNRRLEKLFGYGEGELLGSELGAIHPFSHEFEFSGKDFARAFGVGGTWYREMELKRRNGSPFWARVNANPVDAADLSSGVICVVEDISKQRETERSLRESESRWASAFESAPIGMALISTFGQWLQVNEVLCAMTGYTKEELKEMTFQDITHPEDVEKDVAMYRHLISGKLKSFSTVKRYIHKSGAPVYARISLSLIRDEAGTPLHFIAQVEDITELERLEDEVVKMQRLESLGLLAGGIAHDFNNMLSTIISRIALAKLDAPEGSEMSKHLQMAEKTVMNARGLTHQLLTFSRGGMPLKKAVDTGKFLRDTSSFIMHGATCGCVARIADGLGTVEMDEGQISQVLHNIFINAMQEMPADGTITLTAENAAVDADSRLPLPVGNYVKVSIADTGKGIAPEALGRIFDPFFSTKQKGSGLGLSIAYSVIKKHQGHISVESETGKGATFHIWLPSVAAGAAPEAVIPRSAASGKRVLVMDDDEMFTTVLEAMLKHLGHEVKVTYEGGEAVTEYARALARGERYDAVILDLTVPAGKGGEYAVKELLKMDQGVKAVVSSAYSNNSAMAYYRQHGFAGLLAKPYEMETLRKVLEEMFANGNVRAGAR